MEWRIGRMLSAGALALAAALAAGMLPFGIAGAAHAAELKPSTRAPTPSLALPLLDGGNVDLAALRGKVVLVNFWATWCAPCIKEMPSMQQLAATLPADRFAVIAVNFGETEERIRAFLRKLPIDLPIALDPKTTTARAWGARVLPISFVVDRDGRIRYEVLGDIDWASAEVVGTMRSLTGARSALGGRAQSQPTVTIAGGGGDEPAHGSVALAARREGAAAVTAAGHAIDGRLQ